MRFEVPKHESYRVYIICKRNDSHDDQNDPDD
jgi:hypothetical protein